MSDKLQEAIISVLSKILVNLDSSAEFEFLKEGTQWRINIKTNHEELYKDFRDKTLNSIQHLTRVLVHNIIPEDKSHFTIDLNLKRLRREQALTSRLPAIAKEEVLKTGRPVAVIGLNGYERKLIHDSLHDIAGLETVSFGVKPNRRLVIRPTGDTYSTSGFENARFINIEEIEKDL